MAFYRNPGSDNGTSIAEGGEGYPAQLVLLLLWSSKGNNL